MTVLIQRYHLRN